MLVGGFVWMSGGLLLWVEGLQKMIGTIHFGAFVFCDVTQWRNFYHEHEKGHDLTLVKPLGLHGNVC